MTGKIWFICFFWRIRFPPSLGIYTVLGICTVLGIYIVLGKDLGCETFPAVVLTENSCCWSRCGSCRRNRSLVYTPIVWHERRRESVVDVFFIRSSINYHPSVLLLFFFFGGGIDLCVSMPPTATLSFVGRSTWNLKCMQRFWCLLCRQRRSK